VGWELRLTRIGGQRLRYKELRYNIHMSTFNKDLFKWDGLFLLYGSVGNTRVVARFKRQKSEQTNFRKFLTDNFTVNEYFSKLDEGMSPSKILEEKGYIANYVKKMLKEMGFSADLAGRKQYIKNIQKQCTC